VTTNVTINATNSRSEGIARHRVTAVPGSYGALRVQRIHLVGMDTLPSFAPPTFLTQREVSDLLRLSERTLEDWRLTCQGPPYLKLGRHVRYDLTDVVEWARGQKHG
jgi:hypothetical protein